MTVDEFNQKFQSKMDQLLNLNKPLEIAVRSTMALVAKRIFLDGKNTSGSNIGEYVNKALYVNPKKIGALPKFEAKGKEGDKKFKNGKDHKTGYFENFLSFKEKVGRSRNVKTVDLFLTGDLFRDFANSESVEQAMAEKVNSNYYRVSLTHRNYKKIEAYEKGENGKSPVFKLSQKEKESFKKVFEFEFKKILNA